MRNLEKSKVIKIVLLTFILFLGACRDESKIENLYAYPLWQEEAIYSDKKQDVFLFVTSDLKNTLFPKASLKPPNLPKEMPHSMKVGGAAILKSYMDILRMRFGSRIAFLSFGDLNLKNQDKELRSYLEKTLHFLDFDGILLGHQDLLPPNHQSFSLDVMKKTNWFNSSILSIKSGEPTEQWNSLPYLIIERAGKKIGFIGITSYDLMPEEEKNLINGFYFQDPVSTILRTKNLLKKEGVDLVGLFYQGPNPCGPPALNNTKQLSKLEDSLECKKETEIQKIIDKLPPGAIDFSLGESSSTFLYRGIPVIGLQNPHEFLTGIRFTFNDDNINWEQSLLLEPLKLCHESFAGTRDCVFDTLDKEINHKRFEKLKRTSFHMLPAKFLGHKILENQEVLNILNDK